MKKLLLLTLLVFSATNAQVEFAPYISIQTDSWPETVGIADVNNDGLNDVVLGMASYASSENDYKVLVYLQNDAGELNVPIKYPYSYPNGPDIEGMDLGDVNNDGLTDIVIAFGNKIGIFLQQTDGTMGNNTEIIQPYFTKTLKIGDLNSDGLNDIAVGYTYNNTIATLTQSGTGTFSLTSYTCPISYDIEVGIADLNDDGRNDMVVKSFDSIHVLTQNDAGTLDAQSAYGNGSSTWINGLAIGDLNNDGKADVVASKGGNSPASKITIWNQNPVSHLLDSPINLSAYDIPEPIEIGDMNNDGRNEIIIAHGGWNNISCYEQNISGQYDAYNSFPIPYASHYNRQGLALGDINNDGLKDVAIADYNNGLVILYNISESLNVTKLAKRQNPVIYPNPANNIVNIDFSASDIDDRTEISIWNALGMQLTSRRKSVDIESFNMAEYASGIYYIKIHTAKGDCTSKIIKQ